jgi:ABC-2 type transport system permease protein
MWTRIREIIRKEFLQTLREPRMRVVVFVPPLVQLLIFGYAVNLDVENTPIAWMDRDNTPASRSLLNAFKSSRYFRVTATPAREEDVQQLLDYGRVQAIVRINPGFERRILRGLTANVQVIVEGTNSNTASLVSSYASEIVAQYSAGTLASQQNSRILSRSQTAPANLELPAVISRSRVWFNTELKSRNYFVPGVVVNIIMLVTLMLTSLAIVREKEIGTMEQLMVSPLRPLELIIGKTVPFGALGLLDLVLVTTAALLIFHIPFRGSGTLLLASSILFLLSTLGAGLFISTISQTQQQAMMASFFFFAPAFMLSGFAFPIRNMPEAVQWITYLNPVRYFIEIVRGIFLKGTGIEVLWPQMTALLVCGTSVLAVSALRFHKRLD